MEVIKAQLKTDKQQDQNATGHTHSEAGYFYKRKSLMPLDYPERNFKIIL